MKSKEAYIAKIEAQLREWSTKIDEMKVQSNLAKAEARDEYHRQIKILQEKQSVLSKKLDKLHDTGGEVWDELRFGIDSALGDMKDALKKTLDKFK